MDQAELRRHIRTLATLEEIEAPMISCYFNLEQGVHHLRDTINRRVAVLQRGLPEGDRPLFMEALAQVETYIKNELDSRAKGAALFARAGSRPYFLPLEFPVAVPTSIAVDRSPCIYHLIELQDTHQGYVVVICTETGVQILEVNLGTVTKQVWKERPELRDGVRRRWTKQHYQSHQRELTDRLIREAVDVLEQRVAAAGYHYLVLTGNQQLASRVRRRLPKRLEAVLVDLMPMTSRGELPEVVAAALTSLVKQEQAQSKPMVERLHEAICRHGLAVVGVQSALRALCENRVDVLILAKELDAETRERAVKSAEQHRCRIELVESSDLLMRYGGIGCLLRYRAFEPETDALGLREEGTCSTPTEDNSTCKDNAPAYAIRRTSMLPAREARSSGFEC